MPAASPSDLPPLDAPLHAPPAAARPGAEGVPAERPAERPAARSDGAATRERLLHTGLRLFAQQGYAATTTRELAQAAGVNIAAISYHFGDKAGLYRAVFFEPLGDPQDDIARYSDPALSLEDALRAFIGGLLEPLSMGEAMRQCVKLRMREMIEPTGLWAQEIALGIRPMHGALVALLCRHLGLAEPDAEVQRLAVSLVGLGVHLMVGQDVIEAIAPELNAEPDALERWADSLLRQALAMVEAEQRRRQTPPPASPRRRWWHCPR